MWCASRGLFDLFEKILDCLVLRGTAANRASAEISVLIAIDVVCVVVHSRPIHVANWDRRVFVRGANLDAVDVVHGHCRHSAASANSTSSLASSAANATAYSAFRWRLARYLTFSQALVSPFQSRLALVSVSVHSLSAFAIAARNAMSASEWLS